MWCEDIELTKEERCGGKEKRGVFESGAAALLTASGKTWRAPSSFRPIDEPVGWSPVGDSSTSRERYALGPFEVFKVPETRLDFIHCAAPKEEKHMPLMFYRVQL